MKNQFGKEVTDEEAQQIGMAVLHLVIAKAAEEIYDQQILREKHNEQ